MEKWIECCIDNRVVLYPLSSVMYFTRKLYRDTMYVTFKIKDSRVELGTPVKNKYTEDVYYDLIRFLSNEEPIFCVDSSFICM